MISLLRRYLRKYLWETVANVVFVIAQVLLQLQVVSMTKVILNKGVKVGDVPVIVNTSVVMLLMTLAMGVSVVIASYMSSRVTACVTFDLQEDIFKKIVSLSQYDYSRFGGSTLMTRATSDVSNIQLFLLNFLRSCLLVPFVIVGLIIATAMISLGLCAILVVAFALTIAFMVLKSKQSIPPFNEYRSSLDRLNVLMREKIEGARSIRAFGRRQYETEKFDAVNRESVDVSLEADYRIYFLTPVALIIMNVAVVVIYYLGSIELQSQIVSISDLILFFQYVTYFISSLALIPFLVNTLPKVVVSVARIREVLDFEETIVNDPKTAPARCDGEITFKNVIFGYDGAKDVIADISFHAKPGTTTAFIGATGSGKSTIMYLLDRMYDPTFGEIFVDGVDVRDMDLEALRSRISFASQKTLVLQDTVYNNIAMGDETITRDDAKACCDVTMFSEVLDHLDNGLDSEMAQGGMNVSGGQKQRLSLARAIARDAEIYVFDDTFSALDLKTEAMVRKSIKERLAGRTVIMVAQKISTIRDADNIIVLEKGRIAAQGTHGELLATCPVYQEIYESQDYGQEGGEANG
ncbi:MAG: ABC transporter ATP-binding protein [Atopobiaceae bacterium]|jgi:ATP-binding cassette subfamily B protein|nr:ABC transporter ATP-binding protein/permease [Atopobiaceae bacterium]